jgi:uncharacterized membrane-anchored protein YhcB (DUF1043 family)
MIIAAVAFIVGIAIGAVGYKFVSPKVAATEAKVETVVADIKKI